MNINPIKIIDVKQALGELVKQLRKRENLTQEELAERLVVTRGTIKNLEHGHNPTLDTVLKVLMHFDLLNDFSDFIKSQKSTIDDNISLY